MAGGVLSDAGFAHGALDGALDERLTEVVAALLVSGRAGTSGRFAARFGAGVDAVLAGREDPLPASPFRSRRVFPGEGVGQVDRTKALPEVRLVERPAGREVAQERLGKGPGHPAE